MTTPAHPVAGSARGAVVNSGFLELPNRVGRWRQKFKIGRLTLSGALLCLFLSGYLSFLAPPINLISIQIETLFNVRRNVI